MLDGGRLYNVTGTVLEVDGYGVMVRFDDAHYLRWFPRGVPLFDHELQLCHQTVSEWLEAQEHQRKLADQKRRQEHADKYL